MTPLPELEKPGLHVQPVEPALLVLPAGHAVQDVAPAVGLYVLLGQTGCAYVHIRQGRGESRRKRNGLDS